MDERTPDTLSTLYAPPRAELGEGWVEKGRPSWPGVSLRLRAWALDKGLLVLATIPGCASAVELDRAFKSSETLGAVASALVLILLLGGPIALQCYQWWHVAQDGSTIGKRAYGLRVASLDGSRPGFWRGVVLRSLVPGMVMWGLNLVACMLPGTLFFLVDHLLVAREDRRCLHDLMAGTKVVEATRGGEA